MTKKNVFLLALAVLVAMGATATASVYLTKESLKETDKPVVVSTAKPVTRQKAKHNDDITWNEPRATAQQPAPTQVASNCDDNNIVGIVVGAAAGGLAGHQIGNGSGKTAATIGGTLGGAYLGKNYIPTQNVTCR